MPHLRLNPRLAPKLVRSALLLALFASAAPVLAQVGPDVLARQSLRPYWYVFIAYALAWLLLVGWVLSIGRRLRRLEEAQAGDADA